MKKLLFTAAAASIMITQTGCFGSFEMIKKVYEWNDSVSDSKFVKTLLFYAMNIVPVYSVAGFLDVVVFNLIEFWGGSNPIAMEAGQIEEQLMTFKGQTYKVTATKNQMKFEKITNAGLEEVAIMVFSEKDNTWSYVKGDQSMVVAKINKADHSVDYQTAAGMQTFDLNSVENVAFLGSENFPMDLASK
ncbi:MAG: DUF3332 domain-containing protein [Vicingaceae bacterium]